MKIHFLKIGNYKNLNRLAIDFKAKGGITVILGNNGSGKSNMIEAISAIFCGLYLKDPKRIFNNTNSNYPALSPFDYTIHYEVRNNFVKVEYNTTNGWTFLVTLNGENEKYLSQSDFLKKNLNYCHLKL